MEFVHEDLVNSESALVQAMAGHWQGSKSSAEWIVTQLTDVWYMDLSMLIPWLVMPYGINIGSVNGLLPDGTKPLPEPMLTYHQWPSRVQIVVYHLPISMPLPEPTLTFINWILRNKFQLNFKQNIHTFIKENAFENVVCHMAANLFDFNVLTTFNLLKFK